MKYSLYVLVSFLLASLVLFRAFYLRPNFWSAAILISQSNGSLLILTNLALIWTGGTVYVFQRLFYGRLRPIEVEQLYEKGWVAVTETALALTIFREDVGARFFVMFLSLMVGKIWAWIGEARIEYMEQQPSTSRLPTIRLAASLSVSLLFDMLMLGYCLETLAREPRPGMWVMYAFEYVILLIHSTSLFLRFSLGVAETVIVHRQVQSRLQARRDELRREAEAAALQGHNDNTPAMDSSHNVDEMDIDAPGWEDKGRWMFYLDLMTDFTKSLVYCGFFMVLLFFHGLPLHIMRDLYITVRSFVKRITDFIQYRNATKDMNARYPDATTAELEADNTCIICREEMAAWDDSAARNQDATTRHQDERQRPKKLPCGHILHFGCLRSWLERQRVCPTCRRSVLVPGNATSDINRDRPQNNDIPQGANVNQQPVRNNAQPPPQNGQAPIQFRVGNLGPLVQAFLQQMGNRQQPVNRENQNQQPSETPPVSPQNNIATTPWLVHQQVVHLQMQVLELMQRLNSENLQLDLLERLAAELGRLQSEQNAAAAGNPGNQTGYTAENSAFSVNQAFQPSNSQPGLNVENADLPPGMVLPSGYILRRLHAVNSAQTYSMPMSQNTLLNRDLFAPTRSSQQTSSVHISNTSLPDRINGGSTSITLSEDVTNSSSSAAQPNGAIRDSDVQAAPTADMGS